MKFSVCKHSNNGSNLKGFTFSTRVSFASWRISAVLLFEE